MKETVIDPRVFTNFNFRMYDPDQPKGKLYERVCMAKLRETGIGAGEACKTVGLNKYAQLEYLTGGQVSREIRVAIQSVNAHCVEMFDLRYGGLDEETFTSFALHGGIEDASPGMAELKTELTKAPHVAKAALLNEALIDLYEATHDDDWYTVAFDELQQSLIVVEPILNELGINTLEIERLLPDAKWMLVNAFGLASEVSKLTLVRSA